MSVIESYASFIIEASTQFYRIVLLVFVKIFVLIFVYLMIIQSGDSFCDCVCLSTDAVVILACFVGIAHSRKINHNP